MSSTPSAADREQLLRRRTYNSAKRSWNPWVDLYDRATVAQSTSITYNFCRGGHLVIYPNSMKKEQQRTIVQEVLLCNLFRQYKIQSTSEPRLHFLLHECATECFDDEQPSYRYGCTKMKARPLGFLPSIKQLSADMENLALQHSSVDECDTEDNPRRPFWNVGVNMILYRDGRDKIGFHADNDQGEELILTAVVSSPRGTTRRVCIQSNDGQEQLEINLCAGDAYAMDGEMQQFYKHSVPSDKKSEVGASNNDDEDNLRSSRIAAVFRRGRQETQTQDSGEEFSSLQPRVFVPYVFGRLQGLVEGMTYSRLEMTKMNAHRSQERGVSGNRDVGCDSIIVSGRGNGLASDNLFHLVYTAKRQNGALALLRSSIEGQPVRVFRSNVLDSAFRAIVPEKSSARYRYDGLYKVETIKYRCEKFLHVVKVVNPLDHLKAAFPGANLYLFRLTRVEHGVGAMTNEVASASFVRFCIEKGTLTPEVACLPLQQSSLPLRTPLEPIWNNPQESPAVTCKKRKVSLD